MKLVFCAVGKAHEALLKAAIDDYTRRVQNYFAVEWLLLPPPKQTGLPEADQKKLEAATIKQAVKPGDYLVALDERGTLLSSEGLSQVIEQRASGGSKRIFFLIGGAFGLDKTILDIASYKWSLSPLTFPHQLVRVILAEQ